MKSILIVLCIVTAFLSSASSQDFKKMDDKDVDPQKKETAGKFADEFYNDLKNGSCYQFSDEAIPEVINSLTEERQKAIYQQLKNQFGDYKSSDYAETWTSSDIPGMDIFRFKADFEKSNSKLEIRVVLNGSGKIAGFFIKPWMDML